MKISIKRKVLIVAAFLWLASLVGGSISGWSGRRFYESRAPTGMLEMQKLRQLFASRSFEAVLKECDVAEKDEQSAAYEPQILYLRWEANRDLRKLDESDRWKRLFLDRYPNHTLAADMHLETAMNELVSGDYAAAKNELALIESQFPNAAVAPKVKEIRARMSTLATRTSIQQ